MKTSDLLKKHNFHFKKRFGQNFITDTNLLEKIADGAQVGSEDYVLEIGPGAGTLTRVLAARARGVLALEIDRDLIPILSEQLAEYPNALVVQADALEVDFDQVVQEHFPEARSYKIVANLPYYITTPLIFAALEKGQNLSRMVVMVQKEVAERLQAKPGTKEYGALTVMASLHARVEYLFTVSKKLFTPEPDVDSAIVSFERYENSPYSLKDPDFFRNLVKHVFMQRRKTFMTSIKSLDLPREEVLEFLRQGGHSEQVRGEALPLEFLVALANRFAKK